jgi:predicted type IV restriction endonuclease
MDHLDAVASQVRQRIETFRELPRPIGESNTKASLIEPLLQALGWDVHDPREVHRDTGTAAPTTLSTTASSSTASPCS